MDVFGPDQRHTTEMIARGIIPRIGVRYRSCFCNFSRKPDLLMVDQRKDSLVHGSFSHTFRLNEGDVKRHTLERPVRFVLPLSAYTPPART